MKKNDKKQGHEVSTIEEIFIKSKKFKRFFFPRREIVFFPHKPFTRRSRRKDWDPRTEKKNSFPTKTKNKKQISVWLWSLF